MGAGKNHSLTNNLLSPSDPLWKRNLRLDPVVRPAQPEKMTLCQRLSILLELLNSLIESWLGVARSGPVAQLDIFGLIVSRQIDKTIQVLRSIWTREKPVKSCIRLPSVPVPVPALLLAELDCGVSPGSLLPKSGVKVEEGTYDFRQ